MKVVRIILTFLAVVLAIAALVVAASFSPVLQTWAARQLLGRMPGVQATVASASATPGHVELTDLHFSWNGATLAIPSLRVELSLITACRERRFPIRGLVAKGWTLDLTKFRPAADPAPAPTQAGTDGQGATGDSSAPDTTQQAASTPQAVRVFAGFLSDAVLPWNVSVDGADLDGDILLAAPPGVPANRIHLILSGAGLEAGHTGTFSYEARAEVTNPDAPVNYVAAKGRLMISLEASRAVGRVEVAGDVSATGLSFPQGISVTADATVARSQGQESYSLVLSRGGGELAKLAARLQKADQSLSGSWKINLRDSDLAAFAPDHPLPSFAAEGEGLFASDLALTHAKASGRLKASASRLEVLASSLAPLGQVDIGIKFDLAQNGTSVRVGSLDASLSGAGPSASVHALRPFEFDLKTAQLVDAGPSGDLVSVSLRGFPISWLSGPNDPFQFTSGMASCELMARNEKGGFVVDAGSPVTARGVSVRRGNTPFAEDLDLSAVLSGESKAEGWTVRAAPLTVSSRGRRLATIEGQASQPAGADQPLTLTGNWSADPGALAAQPGLTGLRRIRAKSASGDFTETVGGSTEVESKLVLTGIDPGASVQSDVLATFEPDGTISFQAPTTIQRGDAATDLSAEGTWTPDQRTGPELDLHVSGKSLVLEDLGLFLAPLSAASTSGRNSGAFWGNWKGRVRVALDKVQMGQKTFTGVGGSFEVDPGSIRLASGSAQQAPRSAIALAGSLAFDASAARPYHLAGTLSVGEIEVSPFFPAQQRGKDPTLEGRFALTATVSGYGTTPFDLLDHPEESLQFTSTVGIFRGLSTDVTDAVPEVATPGSDALDAARSVGSVLGTILGAGRGQDDDDSEPKVDSRGKNPVGKTAETILAFATEVAEIGYDSVAVTANQSSDGAIEIPSLSLVAPNEHLTGSGRIAAGPGRPWAARPLSLDLQLAIKGNFLAPMGSTGLLGAKKDELGYTLFAHPFHLGGTIDHLDQAQWHDLLARVIRQKAPAKK